MYILENDSTQIIRYFIFSLKHPTHPNFKCMHGKGGSKYNKIFQIKYITSTSNKKNVVENIIQYKLPRLQWIKLDIFASRIELKFSGVFIEFIKKFYFKPDVWERDKCAILVSTWLLTNHEDCLNSLRAKHRLITSLCTRLSSNFMSPFIWKTIITHFHLFRITGKPHFASRVGVLEETPKTTSMRAQRTRNIQGQKVSPNIGGYWESSG